MPQRLTLIVVGALTTVALILLIICGVTVVQTRAFLAESVPTTGEVIGLVPRQSCNDSDDDGRRCTTVYAPRIRFQTGTGESVVFTSDVGSNPAGYATGDQIQIRYRPGAPADAKVDSLTGTWLGSMITGGIGLFFAGFAVLWFVIGRRTRPRSAPVHPERVEPEPVDPEPVDPEPDDPKLNEPSDDPEPSEPRSRVDREPSNPFL